MASFPIVSYLCLKTVPPEVWKKVKQMDLTGAVWRKSSRSGAGDHCVEMVVARAGTAVRDSKNPNAGHIEFGTGAWSLLMSTVRTA